VRIGGSEASGCVRRVVAIGGHASSARAQVIVRRWSIGREGPIHIRGQIFAELILHCEREQVCGVVGVCAGGEVGGGISAGSDHCRIVVLSGIAWRAEGVGPAKCTL
jgi:hypothetical protein